MRRRCLLAALTCLVLGAVPAARTVADTTADDEQALRQAGIATDGAGLLRFFRQRTLEVADETRIQTLIRQLGDDQFKVREKASHQLVSIGPRARPFLQAALKDADPEIARRAQECLRRIGEGATSSVMAAAVRVLAKEKPPESVGVLLAYLPAAEDAPVSEAIRDALAALVVRDGKAEPALLAALTDKSALKRAAAAVALCHARLPEVLPGVRKLLEDGDARVRLHVGLALAALRDKDAVPVLLRLLDELPLRDIEPVMTLLERLAGDTMPPVVYGPDAASHRKYREAWVAWWKDHQAGLDPARLEQASRLDGSTLVVLLDVGVMQDLDSANRVRWKIEGLQKPLDAQLLPGGKRVLVAEYDANRVSERNLKGEIVWQKAFQQGPLAAQRLANGNTFVTMEHGLFEVDKEGRNVFVYTRPDGATFMRATKLRNGDIACVTQLGIAPASIKHFVLLRQAGREFREIKTWVVNVGTFGGRIDVLPDGHVLIPERDNNRVVEYDADGQSVWGVTIDQPVVALRLPNGHTLITLFRENRAVEVDRAGKEVWQFKADTKVTRAFRR
jgi:HEAT repeat protein